MENGKWDTKYTIQKAYLTTTQIMSVVFGFVGRF
jgi:hypothetical protein